MMKRDIDLARGLLLDIEARGADCSVSVLRTDANHDAEERVRYHLRLLVDAGYLKEVDRTASGVPCLRLTDAGHELIELVRVESRWRQAKWACQERTGGLSLTVVRGILLEWALSGRRGPRVRRRYRAAAPLVVDGPYDYEPAFDYEPAYDRANGLDGVEIEDSWRAADRDGAWYVRIEPRRNGGWRPRRGKFNGELDGEAFAATLPDYLI
jgi:hypothetical protein